MSARADEIDYETMTFEQLDGQVCALCGKRVPGWPLESVTARPDGPSPQIFIHTPSCPDPEASQ
jgi:hypothetical protein